MNEALPPAAPRRRWRAALAIVLVAALVPIGGVAWLVRSDCGSAWLLARVPGLEVTGTTGRLVGGAFSAERVALRLGQRTLAVHNLAWQDAQWSLRPHEGAWLGLTLVAASAARVDFGGEPSSEPLTLPATLRLPLLLTLQGARVGALQIDGQASLTDLRADAVLGARDGAEHRVSELAFTWGKAQLRGRATLASDAPFTLDAQVDARARDGAAPPWQARASARGPLATLALQAQLGSDRAPGATLRAEARVQPFAAWPLAALAASTQDLDLASFGSGLPTTRLTGRADIDTRGLDAPVTAHIALTNAQPGRWDLQRLPITGLELDLAGQARDRSHLTVQRFALLLAEGAGRIDGSGEWHADAAQLALRLQAMRPALLDARAAAMTLGGTATLQLSGLPSPDGTRALAATQRLQARLALDGRLDARSAQSVRIGAQADAERSGATWRIEVRDAQLKSGDARGQATLGAARDAAGAWQLRSQGEVTGFDPVLWFPSLREGAWQQGPHRLAGRWQGDLQGHFATAAALGREARVLALRGQVELDLRDSLLAGVPLQGHVKLDGRAEGWAVDADLHAGANHATLRGRLAPRASDDRWRMDLDAPALTVLQPLLGLQPGPAVPVSGQLSGFVQAQGRWPAVSVNANLHASALQAGRVKAARVQAQLQAGPDARAALDVRLDVEQLSVDSLRADTLQARLEGSLAEHRLVLDVQGPLRPPAWAEPLLGSKPNGSRVLLRAQGQWLPADPGRGPLPGGWHGQNLELEARALGSEAAASNGVPWLRARDVRLQLQLDAQGRPQSASADPGRAEALGTALHWTVAQWHAGSDHAPAEVALDAQLEPLAVAPWLARLMPASGLGGNLMLAGHARIATGARVSADVVLERAGGDLTLTDDTGTQTFGLSDLRLAIAAQDGTWHFTQALAGSNLGVLAGAQSLRLPVQATWPQPDSPMQGVLEWQIADLGAWAPFTPPGWRLGGRLRTGAALGGTFGAPEITGELTGSRLALRNLLQGVDVRDGELALSLRGDQANIDRFVFKGGNGELRLTGGASLGAEPSAKLQLAAERFQLLGRFDRRITASGNATLLLAPRALDLDGRFRIDEGLIDFSRVDAPSLDSDVQVHGGRAASAPAASSDSVPRPGGTSRTVRVALQFDLGDDLKLRGRGLDTRLRGSVALSTPAGRVALNGSVRTEAGSYAAYGQKLAIERGVLTFNGAADNPRLDILALRPNLDLRVGVLVSGSAQLPRVRLYSEPDMSDTDKLSWLVLGRAPDGLARADTALLQRAALALLAGEGEGKDKALLANLGLDELSVRQTETGDVKETVVTLGKQISRRWYVGYERGVNATTGTWQLIYRIAQRLTLRAQAGEDNALDAIWTWRWN